MTQALRASIDPQGPASWASAGSASTGGGARTAVAVGPLLVLPALAAWRDAQGRVVVTRKLLEGCEAYARAWPGRVVMVLAPADRLTDNLDNVIVDPAAIGFDLEVLPLTDERVRERVREAAIVLGVGHVEQRHLGAWCREAGVPLVLNTELSLRTRWQIARNAGLGPLRLLRRLQWEWTEERRLRAAMRQAAGVQCAGTPTHEAYRSLNRDALLYFDSRTTAAMVVGEATLEARIRHLLDPARPPLRLAFSGRLVPIKGVQQLPALCARLRELGVRFEFRVFGDGSLRESLRSEIDQRQLGPLLRLEGVLDHATQLAPEVSRAVDLFVCPHLQGDPSCTYIETLACGVPIVGYANEAWAGMLRHGVQGWSVGLGDVEALARRIQALDHDRGSLAQAARAARAFGLEHCFERTFEARIGQLRRLARQVGAGCAEATG